MEDIETLPPTPARLVTIREILAIVALLVGVVSIGIGGFMLGPAYGFIFSGVALFGLGYLLGSA